MHSLVCGRITPWRNRAYCCMKSTCEACRFGSKIGGGNYTSMLRVAWTSNIRLSGHQSVALRSGTMPALQPHGVSSKSDDYASQSLFYT